MRVVVVFVVWAALIALSGCQPGPRAKPVVPDGFDVPSGVRITDGGSKRQIGKAATVVYRIEQGAASAVTVTLTELETGDLARDFRFFNLPEEVKTSTPLYAHLSVRNEGPSGLGGVALPVLLRTVQDKVFRPNDLVGTFRPCPKSALPKSFLPGEAADVCLIFLLPEGQTAASVDIQTGEARDAIHFLAPVP